MNRRALLKSSALAVGYAISTSIGGGCQSEEKQISLNWTPIFLTNNQAQLIADIAETILPRTQTLGAKDLNLDRFIDKMLKDTLSVGEQKDFLSSLNAFESGCKNAYSKPFSACINKEKNEFVLTIDRTPVKSPPSVFGVRLDKLPPTFAFQRVKELTLLGFFTAQDIGEKVLTYDPVPGIFVGCVPLSQIGNAWNE
jgi:Gluconate 2-dehydrogenase subunit 3